MESYIESQYISVCLFSIYIESFFHIHQALTYVPCILYIVFGELLHITSNQFTSFAIQRCTRLFPLRLDKPIASTSAPPMPNLKQKT